MTARDRITAPLTTPIKRIGFILLVVGLTMTLIGFIQIGGDLYRYRWLEKFVTAIANALSFERYNYRNYPLASIGPYLALTGLLLSYLYDRSIGRLLAWIQRG